MSRPVISVFGSSRCQQQSQLYQLAYELGRALGTAGFAVASGGYSGTIVGALILTVLASLLTVLNAPQPIRQIVYGAIILGVAAAYFFSLYAIFFPNSLPAAFRGEPGEVERTSAGPGDRCPCRSWPCGAATGG